MIVWTGKQTTDHETFSIVLQADVDGSSVSVYVSQEAMDDMGVEVCKRIAERKIADAAQSGAPPRRVTVSTQDRGD